MGSVTRFLDSSIGRKVLMSLTGLFLCTFLIVHATGNLQLFKNDMGLAFNQYSVFMTTFTPIKIVSYLLYATILLHAISGIRLALANKAARPVGYGSSKAPGSSSWASSNMMVLGFIILIFLVTHMSNFWYKYKFGDVEWVRYEVSVMDGSVMGKSTLPSAPNMQPHEYVVNDGVTAPTKFVIVKDLYSVVQLAFQEVWIVALYLLGMLAIAYHLVHGFQSSFQTLGLRHPAVAGIIRNVGVWVFGIIIPIAFASMPVYFFFFA
ncbi:MAG: succinate dehydrogenase cytochrome b subunit [Bacteroidota bacterium]|jgi:succinate dehydrogenase / fumarate reductase cytochrome b subunit